MQAAQGLTQQRPLRSQTLASVASHAGAFSRRPERWAQWARSPRWIPSRRPRLPNRTASTVEWTTDTTRTIASLVFTGTAARFPDIRWIFSHGGGTAPFLIGRFQTQEALMKDRERRFPQGVMHEMRKFYYDTAQANHSGALAALLAIVPPTQVLLGTDYPLRKPAAEIGAVGAYPFSASDLRAIERDNALRLIPRIAA